MTDPTPVSDQQPRRAAASRQRRSARKIAEERQRQQTRMRWIGLAAVALVVIAIAGIVIASRRANEASIPAGTQSFDGITAGHSSDPVDYAENPPVGGIHDPVWQNCGFYAAPIRSENAVHSLEHGAVWITYQPDLPQDQILTLQNLATSQSFVLVSPLEGIPAPVVASSWGRQLQLDSADDERLQQFIGTFRLSPLAPEPGASCSGGTSATV